jgi:hypothetical protein
MERQYLNNVRWEYSETVLPDYVMGGQACALYLRFAYRLLLIFVLSASSPTTTNAASSITCFIRSTF